VEVEGETLLEGEVEKGWGEGQVLLYPGEAARDGVLKIHVLNSCVIMRIMIFN
jgi:hypothetical protein